MLEAQLFDRESDRSEAKNRYAAHPEVADPMLVLLAADVDRGCSTEGPDSANDVARLATTKADGTKGPLIQTEEKVGRLNTTFQGQHFVSNHKKKALGGCERSRDKHAPKGLVWNIMGLTKGKLLSRTAGFGRSWRGGVLVFALNGG